MIYAISLNSSIDFVVYCPEFSLEGSWDSQEEYLYPGGKAINVSRVLNGLGIPVKLLGFVGGLTGHFIEKTLYNEGVESNFVHTLDRSRLNIKIKAKQESEIEGRSSQITDEELGRFFKTLHEVESGDLVLLCGSLPTSFSQERYQMILSYLQEKKIEFVVDAKGESLRSTLPYRPFLIKPNLSEVESFFGVTLTHLDQVIEYGKKLQQLGADNVVVSLAHDGALLITKDEVWMAFVPEVSVQNSVGAGDSLVAGMVASLRRGSSLLESFHYGVAVSVTSVASKMLVELASVEYYFQKIRLRKL